MSFLFSQPAPGILPPDSVSFDELAEISANSILGNPTGTQANAVSVDSNLFFISTATNRIGIGSTNPNAKLQVNNSGSQLGLAVYSTSSNNTAELYNQGTTNYTLALNSAANSAFTGASIGGYFARGTLSSRTQTLANDSLLSISASGHTGTAVAGISAAVVLGADENTSANAYGGQVVIATTPNNTPGGFPIPRVYVKNDGKVNIPDLTASQVLATDALKNLQSLTTTTYPSLTELSYVKGVSSSVQNQLNGKASTQLDNLGTTAINAHLLFSPDNTYDIGADGASRPNAIHAANHITAPLVRARDNDGLSQRHLIVRAGNSTTGNGDGGDLTVAAGTPHGTGTAGTIVLQTAGITAITIDTAQNIKSTNYILNPISNSQTQSVSGSLNINWETAPIQIITLNANITSLTFSNVVEGGAYLIKIIQGASGGPYTISWPTMKWLGGTPTLSTTANAVDVISLTYVGGEYLAVASLGFV